MSYVGFLSSINSSYYIYGDFNIHVDVSVGDDYKFMTFLDSCDLKQLVDQPTYLHGHILDLILSPSDQDTTVNVKICDFVSDYALVKFSITFALQVVDLCEQYAHDLGNLLDRHAPFISRLTKKDSANLMSDDNRRAKSLRHQFERTWPTNPLNRSRLRRQIAKCSALVNKDKSDYYRKLIF